MPHHHLAHITDDVMISRVASPSLPEGAHPAPEKKEIRPLVDSGYPKV